ncbi:asparagine synthase (glutamine-hydrolyzing) [Candidatus Parcubacteria bacterium]|nr:asparagine synthase (glutamine-hydrolyzing) [Candidatus Parcubacteria bacterium]
MCGIAGYHGKGDREILEKMTNALKHRGPDDKGCYFNGKVGLGHRRLSIIDLSSEARQPMLNKDCSIIVAFNGEIYNFKKLRDELKFKKHNFKTNSDTEIIIHAYEEYGEECFGMFNGMFAIAIWDNIKKQLILARDRFGQKPLYYFYDNNNLIFASEIKSLLTHPEVKKDLDELAIWQYFSFDYAPQPNTIFKNIKKLENGQLLIYKDSKIKLKYYYEISLKENFNISEEEAISELNKLLEKSINMRLISDVPLGVFLSGGLDSSTIAYYAKRQKNNLKTFSIGFDEQSFDETKYAKQVADYLKTDHYHKQFSGQELIEVIPKVFEKLDEPFGDPSILPTYLLSEFTREKVTVALSGDGGDELLCGYPNHKAQKLLAILPHNLKLNKAIVNIIVKCLPFSEKNMASSFKMQRMLLASQFNGLYRDFIVIGGYNNQFDKLFDFEVKKDTLFDFAANFLVSYQNYSYFQKVNLLFQKYYLSDDILFKADRASMYNSLEVRAPFLDFQVADFLNSLPMSLKLKGFNKSKYILKRLMQNKLPDNIINRQKKGFGVPITKWLNQDLKDFMLDSLSRKNIEKIGFLNHNIVEKLIKQHLNRQVDNRKILWNLIVFQNWYKNII